MTVNFKTIKPISAGQPFRLYFYDVQNPPSLRRSSSFTNILLTDKSYNEIASYEKDVWVENLYVSHI